nr:DUF2069 domain-containing protein [Oceanococcus sp. HetDA_MAG_MS8]
MSLAGRLATAGLILSLISLWVWTGWLQRSPLGVFLSIPASILLLALLPGHLRGRLRSHQLGSMLSCLYLAIAAADVFAANQWTAAGWLLLSASLWFAGSLLYCRGELRRGQQIAQQGKS